MFYTTEHYGYNRTGTMPMPNEIEILIENDTAIISWNDETIQEIAEDMGEPEFPEPRPCG